jgi:hypothetical protein
MIPKHKAYRNPKYRKFVSDKPCLITGTTPCDCHHENKDGEGTMGGKPGDERGLPYSREIHQERHQIGKKAFYKKYYWIDPKEEIIRLLTEYLKETI